ncbi:MAG: response regulator [Candidatus Binatia bacterium]
MAELGRILIADDEESFLQSTADLLRREGYECSCALSAKTAAEMLGKEDYDLLIADIKMPGNPDLELIRELPRDAKGMPVILVTGYPSVKSAVQAIQLPVVAYLIKPVDFSDLLAQVQSAVKYSRIYRAMSNTQEHLESWRQDLDNLEELKDSRPREISPDIFLANTIKNVGGCLVELKRILEMLAIQRAEQQAGRLLCGLRRTTTDEKVTDGEPDLRAIKLERALQTIANDLEEAGIVTGADPAKLDPLILEELRNLSPREWEILRLLRANYRVATIAQSLHISPNTVRNHLKSIFQKLGVRSQMELLERLGSNAIGR